MKIKTINYELLNSTLNYRLNDKKLYLYHKGLNINNNPLDFNVDLIINEDGNIYNSLEIEIEKINDDKYEITYADGSIDTLYVLYYFLDDNNERIYVDKEDVTINPDGSMEYNGHIVKSYYKNNNGYSLKGDYEDFINSDYIFQKNEEIEQLEQELININGTIKDLEYQNTEYGKVFDDDYIAYETYSNNIEQLSHDILNLQVQLNNTIASENSELYDAKDDYYNKIKKSNINEDQSPVTAYGLTGTANNYSVSPSVQQYLYVDENGKNMEINNLHGYFADSFRIKDVNGTILIVTQYEQLTESFKDAKFYEQAFNQEVEQLNQRILALSNEIEQETWAKQQQINLKNSQINTKQSLLLNKKNILETRYNTIRNTYYIQLWKIFLLI